MEYAYLKVKAGAREHPVNLSSERLTIGRHESNRLVIDDTGASRFHCVIERGPKGYLVRDLQSRNGTLVNGQRIMHTDLKSGDVITIGQVQMTLIVRSSRLGAEPAHRRAADEPEAVDELEVVEDDTPAGGTPFQVLRRTADAMLERDFDLDAIVLINLRGKPLHEAGAMGESPTELLLRLILLICFRSHSTDIHLEPRTDDFLLRLRMDGNLLDIAPLPMDAGVRLSAMIKVLCELDTTQRQIVQEGHFATEAPDGRGGMRRVDYRVSFVPSLHGQKLVVRIFDTVNAPLRMEHLLLPGPIAEPIGEQLHKDAGLILVCGPTGSGKTTTLYALLRSCGASFRNIVTIEDPVEVQIEGTTQLPVDEESGKGFAALLRSVLRQDPDVIMVGEIRDPETARIALQASMTGHLVLSTIHTRDTVGTIFRLLDLGIEPYMVAQGLHLVLAQRLVRKLCQSCRRGVAPNPDDRRRLGVWGQRVEKIFAPVGCPRCLGTGYYSRQAFFEFLATDDRIREQIMRRPEVTEFQKLLGPDFSRLADQGYRLVAEGVTSIDEVERVVLK